MLDRPGPSADLREGPHILVCTDSEDGVTTYSGTWSSAYDALAHLADHESGQQPFPGADRVRCSIAPLLPPDRPGEKSSRTA